MGVCLGSDNEGQGWSESEASTGRCCPPPPDTQLLQGPKAPAPRSWLVTASEWAVPFQQLALNCGHWHGATSSSPP